MVSGCVGVGGLERCESHKVFVENQFLDMYIASDGIKYVQIRRTFVRLSIRKMLLA